MRVAVFGLGYVGTVCGTCLASAGHYVVGVDVHQAKIDMVNDGIAPVVEPGLQDVLTSVSQSRHFTATLDPALAMAGAEVILVCVGTPAKRDGSLNLDYLNGVLQDVASNLSNAADYPVIAIRSTVPPGTLARCTETLAMLSGLHPGQDFGLVTNPEFLREGSALSDFNNPPYTLVGTDHLRALEVMKSLYGHLQSPLIHSSIGSAELLKYVNNSFHALKIAFANEVGNICKSLGIDSHEVMNIFCRDTHLNISPAYMKPGFAYGGSCLPKDLQALNHTAQSLGVKTPVLAHVAESNSYHLQQALQLIEDTGKRRIGFLGLSFKAQTDDLRESPSVHLVETLLGRGYSVKIYDPHVNVSRLIGANRDFIETKIAHLSALLQPALGDLLECSDVVVVTNNDSSFGSILDQVQDHHVIIDLTRLPGSGRSSGRYHGICW